MSEMKEITGHVLNIGDHVRMNIQAIGAGDLDGVEFTATGVNYWRYMNQHPNEVYTVEEFDFSNDEEVSYVLSGYMSGNNWYANELILLPESKTRFEAIKNMTFNELANFLAEFTSKQVAWRMDVGEIEAWLESEYSGKSFDF